MSRQWRIYVLSDPRAMEPVYVGCTSRRLEQRLGEHLVDSQNRLMRAWFAILRRESLSPRADTLYVFDDERAAHAWERSTIQALAAQGVMLLNKIHRGKRVATAAHVWLWGGGRQRRLELGAAIGSCEAERVWRGSVPRSFYLHAIEEAFGLELDDWLTFAVPLSAA